MSLALNQAGILAVMSLEAGRENVDSAESRELAVVESAHGGSHRDWPGTLIGLLVFLGGVALLVLTFARAYAMFGVPAGEAMGVKPGQPLDVGAAGQTFAGMIVQVLLLLVMAAIGSIIANRGIKLYTDALHAVGKSAGRR